MALYQSFVSCGVFSSKQNAIQQVKGPHGSVLQITTYVAFFYVTFESDVK